mgnify:CR=1 FL=1
MNKKTKIIGSGLVTVGLIAGALLVGNSPADSSSSYRKIDDNTIEVTKTVPSSTIPSSSAKSTYDIDFLLKQKEAVAKDYDNNVAKCDAEIATRQAEKDEVDKLILEAGKLGIEADPVESVTP